MGRRKLTEEEKAEKAFNANIERIKDRMESDLRDLRRERIPDPAYVYDIGDRIQYGNWDWTAILEVIDGGKIYKCFSVTWLTGRNVPDHSSIKIHYLPWFDALPHKTEYPQRLTEDDDVRLNFQQRHIAHLLRLMVDECGIDLDADYQRGHVWNLNQKEALIDSIFKNVDIGKFTVIKRPWGDNPNVPATPLLYEALDGKQRITAIYEFYTGKFTYKGKYFYELHPMDRHHFKEYGISYAESSGLTAEQKYRYFLKLNTTGTPIPEEHMNKVRKLWLEEQKKKVMKK